MKLERLHISVILGLAVALWAAALLIQGDPLSWEHLAPFGSVVGALTGIAVWFEKILWRQPWVPRWFVKRPDLRGTWRVELQSSYIRPIECPQEGCTEKLPKGERVPKIICYMGVEQTLGTLQMHLMTPESESWFIADQIQPSPNGNGYQVVGVYTNKPNIHLRRARTSEKHRGALEAETHGPKLRPETMTAEYWSDRETSGDMDFTKRIDKVYTRFEDADAAFEKED